MGELTVFNIEKAFGYRVYNNLTYAEIAKLMDCSVAAITKALKEAYPEEVLDKDRSLEKIQKNRIIKLATAHDKMLDHLAEMPLEGASVSEVARATSLLHQQERLESNKSTSNVGISWAALMEKHNKEGEL